MTLNAKAGYAAKKLITNLNFQTGNASYQHLVKQAKHIQRQRRRRNPHLSVNTGVIYIKFIFDM